MSQTIEEVLSAARAAELLGALDQALALSLCELAGEVRVEPALLLALTSHDLSEGHVCLPLASLTGRVATASGEQASALSVLAGLSSEALTELIQSSGLSGEVAVGEQGPLVLDLGRLYLRRLFEHEQQVAQRLAFLAGRESQAPVGMFASLERLFGPTGGGDGSLGTGDAAAPDLQRHAAQVAASRMLTVISGGPGTGKTSTVVKILALLVEGALASGRPVPRLALLAPTGKAAARMSEAIGAAKSKLACSDEVLAAIGHEATTIHRALGARPGRATFSRGAERPLDADVILVDEASMVDLALMGALLAAVPRQARLILLGDQDQLASVEAGAVLGDVCGSGVPESKRKASVLEPCVVQLTRSYRFRGDSGIGKLAHAVRSGDQDEALVLLNDDQFSDVELVPVVPERGLGPLGPAVIDGYGPYLRATQPEQALSCFEQFRVLCARRVGPYGVEGLNVRIEQHLRRRGLLTRSGKRGAGNPLLIQRNDHAAKLYNGDIGLLWYDQVSGSSQSSRVAFSRPDGSVRLLAQSRLPQVEPVYAMTVHKSQGSEFDHVAVVLAPEHSPLVSRELLYTAITRAKKKVTIYGHEKSVRKAIAVRSERCSGLRERLWGE